MLSAGFEPTIPAHERPQTYPLKSTATGTGFFTFTCSKINYLCKHPNTTLQYFYRCWSQCTLWPSASDSTVPNTPLCSHSYNIKNNGFFSSILKRSLLEHLYNPHTHTHTYTSTVSQLWLFTEISDMNRDFSLHTPGSFCGPHRLLPGAISSGIKAAGASNWSLISA